MKLIELNGKYYMECDVAMLNTNDIKNSTSLLKAVPNLSTLTKEVVKNSWSREEVESLLFKYAEENHAWFTSKSEIEHFNEWIKENL